MEVIETINPRSLESNLDDTQRSYMPIHIPAFVYAICCQCGKNENYRARGSILNDDGIVLSLFHTFELPLKKTKKFNWIIYDPGSGLIEKLRPLAYDEDPDLLLAKMENIPKGLIAEPIKILGSILKEKNIVEIVEEQYPEWVHCKEFLKQIMKSFERGRMDNHIRDQLISLIQISSVPSINLNQSEKFVVLGNREEPKGSSGKPVYFERELAGLVHSKWNGTNKLLCTGPTEIRTFLSNYIQACKG